MNKQIILQHRPFRRADQERSGRMQCDGAISTSYFPGQFSMEQAASTLAEIVHEAFMMPSRRLRTKLHPARAIFVKDSWIVRQRLACA